MLPWTLEEVAALTGGELVKGEAKTKVLGVVHDTRNVKKGDLFMAIVGDRLDGHKFLAKAAAKGAKAAVVSRRIASVKIAQVLVKDTTKALGDLGRAQRLQWNGLVVAVTGSVGKTTAKDMAAHLLSGTFRTLKTKGNLNNQYGLPLTLLGLTAADEAAVVELGINHPGEMEVLSDIARPDVTVVTAIGEAHLGFFRGKGHLALEKQKIAVGLREGGMRVLNGDDPFLKTKGDKVMTFGLKNGQVRARGLRVDDFATRFMLTAPGARAQARLGMPGEHNVINALAAVAAGLALGVPLKTLVKRLSTFKPQAAMRMQLAKVKGVLFVNDAYNASPTSMEAALGTFKGMKASGRKIAVLGDMLEMGSFSRSAHERIVRLAAKSSLDGLVLVGKQMAAAGLKALPKTSKRVWLFDKAEAAGTFLRRWALSGDAVLLKGSRGMRLEKVQEGF